MEEEDKYTGKRMKRKKNMNRRKKGVYVRRNTVLFLKKKKKKNFAQKISEIHRVTKLRNCSFNQFALVVPRRASDRECTVLGSYEYSSEKQVQRKNTAAVG